jgi:hypothetical protein
MSPGGARGMGERIAAARKLRRMTQAELAEAAAISVSLLRKIELGTRPVTPGVWSSIGRTLGLDGSGSADDAWSAGSRVSAAIPHIRCALDCYDLPDDGPIPPLPDLLAATEKATADRLAAQYTSLADTLPELIAGLTRAAHSHAGHDQETAFGPLPLLHRAGACAALDRASRRCARLAPRRPPDRSPAHQAQSARPRNSRDPSAPPATPQRHAARVRQMDRERRVGRRSPRLSMIFGDCTRSPECQLARSSGWMEPGRWAGLSLAAELVSLDTSGVKFLLVASSE